MELYIGGFAQNKLDYVLGKYPKAFVFDETTIDGLNEQLSSVEGNVIVLNHFHLWIKGLMKNDQFIFVDNVINMIQESEKIPNTKYIIISDEIGNGVIPLDAFERDYRENVGRTLVKIANSATHVERIICGIGQILK